MATHLVGPPRFRLSDKSPDLVIGLSSNRASASPPKIVAVSIGAREPRSMVRRINRPRAELTDDEQTQLIVRYDSGALRHGTCIS
jgi:hypothetical protein